MLTSSALAVRCPAGLHPKVTGISSGKLASKITKDANLPSYPQVPESPARAVLTRVGEEEP